MSFASIVPLIGGETIAMQNVSGKKPEYILSYSAFEANDNQLVEYYDNKVPYYHLDGNMCHTEHQRYTEDPNKLHHNFSF